MLSFNAGTGGWQPPPKGVTKRKAQLGDGSGRGIKMKSDVSWALAYGGIFERSVLCLMER